MNYRPLLANIGIAVETINLWGKKMVHGQFRGAACLLRALLMNNGWWNKKRVAVAFKSKNKYLCKMDSVFSKH
ncbi:MAG: hypothetical protein IJ761_06340 [Bacteroidales bacterium]|nr:hypothetical protein [Bacteroidales bacterium]